MSSLNVKSKYCRYGNWIINLSVLLCNLNIIISESKSCDGNNGSRKAICENICSVPIVITLKFIYFSYRE